MGLKKNKKGFFPGWDYIVTFFIIAILFVFIIGFYDFSLVEIYNPVHETLGNSLDDIGITNESLAVQKFNENAQTVYSYNLPFNLLFIFLFFISIALSIVNVTKTKKLDPMELIFKTIGGIIFFIYLMQLIIFKIIIFFKVQIVDYLFTDLIPSYVPFYLYTYNNAGIIMLVWGIALILINWYFGEKEQKLSLGPLGR